MVLALESVESRTVYVSWSGELAVNRNQGFESLSSVVEIGKRFASALGLRDEEQVGNSEIGSSQFKDFIIF